MRSGSFKNIIKMCLHIIYVILMFKQDLALNNQQFLICHKTKPNQTNRPCVLVRKYINTLSWVRINFYLLRTFCPHFGSFFFCVCVCVFFFFHYVSAKFHLWPSSGDFTATSDRNDRQQLWKAVITWNMVTGLIIPIRGRGKIT